MRKLKELWDKIGVQFIKFGMVGVSNTVVSLATYYLFTFFGVHYPFLANVQNLFIKKLIGVVIIILIIGATACDIPRMLTCK